MKTEEILKQIERIASSVTAANVRSLGPYAQACEFLRQFAGEKSSFYKEATELKNSNRGRDDITNRYVMMILGSFAEYLKAGLVGEITPERKAQLDVVSDLLEQANSLLGDSEFHPAAAAVLIGATLEEFMRTWVEKEGLLLGNKKPSIDSYAKVLKEAELIDKQDIKDITAWAGVRNDAAHGKWEQVESREKISIMLQGVSLFLRKYQTGKPV